MQTIVPWNFDDKSTHNCKKKIIFASGSNRTLKISDFLSGFKYYYLIKSLNLFHPLGYCVFYFLVIYLVACHSHDKNWSVSAG